MTEKDLIGKTVEKVDIDEHGIDIVFTDGTIFSCSWHLYARIRKRKPE